MPDRAHSHTLDAIRAEAQPFDADERAFDAVLRLVGDRRLVLIGEASHGTHEFYRIRADLTRRLVDEHGFTGVAVEADWPDSFRVNRWVRGRCDEGQTADEALAGFRRFPRWMWRNEDVLDFVEWLRARNDAEPDERRKAGFYGLDLYSLHGSIEAVLRYLEQVDPLAAERARYRYACFEHFGEDPQAYGYAASFDLEQSCENAVLHQLVELRRQADEYARRDGHAGADEFFSAEQNARLVLNAEQYYRSMFRGRASSWNLRDTHMGETLDALVAHLAERGGAGKVVVWAHNSHLGDARATEMGWDGELNLGQLARQRYGEDALLVGFTTHTGTVTAANDWDAPGGRKRVRPSLPGSVERLFHDTGIPRFVLPLGEGTRAGDALREERLERAIGVIYRPETERMSHYFQARLSEQFDVVVHVDETRALTPLEPDEGWHAGEAPETYPSAL